MILFENVDRKLERHQLQLLLLLVTLVFIGLLSMVTLRYQIWELHEGVLSRGIFRGLSVHLSDIEFIRLGMPPAESDWFRKPTPAMIEQRENALVLGLRDNSLLPLNLLNLENGHAIHEALLVAIGKANREPFSPPQKRALSGRGINAILHVKGNP